MMAGARLLTCLIGLVLVVRQVAAAPLAATDNYLPQCAFQPDPPPSGWSLWSSPSTWPGGVVPGVGSAQNVDAVIPCGKNVLLNVPVLNLALLHVQGFLKFADDPKVGNIQVRAAQVLVEGQLSIGTPAQQFSHKAVIILYAANGRRSLLFTGAPADPAHPRDLGLKVFAVVGGQVNFHGMPGGPSTMSWTQLAKTASAGATTVTVNGDASRWPVGSLIVIPSTDYLASQAENRTIVAVTRAGALSVIHLDKPLTYMHWGDSSLPDGFGGNVDERGEVGMLTRNIVIQGEEDPGLPLEGGHFIIFQTQTPQYIEGVEFVGMGQQGVLGRYPVHFHLAGLSNRASYVRKSVIRNSKQRCVVIHGTGGVTIDSNIAYNTHGHCFMLEDGGETGNVFSNNLGVFTQTVSVKISSDETDDKCATFWITNPNNVVTTNHAAGSDGTGFWYELREEVRGLSAKLPGLANVVPRSVVLGKFIDNVAHSTRVGMTLYPHGHRPRLPSGVPSKAVYQRPISYKNAMWGFYVHDSDNVVIDGATLADNGWGVYVNVLSDLVISNGRMVGFTNNYGNPSGCSYPQDWSDCVAATSCSFPPKKGEPIRSLGYIARNWPRAGAVLDQGNRSDPGVAANQIVNMRFSGYGNSATCRNQDAAIELAGVGDLFNAAQSVSKSRFAPGTNKLWMIPRMNSVWEWYVPIENSSEVASMFALRDVDGSLVGGTGGFAVANSPIMISPKPGVCKFQPLWNGYACQGTCYRTVKLYYEEPGFEGWRIYQHGQVSWLVITRLQDGAQQILDGNIWNGALYTYTLTQRTFFLNLLAGYTYTVQAFNKAGAFVPASYTVSFNDGLGCGHSLNFRFPNPSNRHWTADPAKGVFSSLCTGVSTPYPATVATFSSVCGAAGSSLDLNLAAAFQGVAVVYAVAGAAACTPTQECGIFAESTPGWLTKFKATANNPPFYAVKASVQGWVPGPAGVFGLGEDGLTGLLPKPSATQMSYYFRRQFAISNPACFSSLHLSYVLDDGLVFYLNGVEILRDNMPAGPIGPLTSAIDQRQPLWVSKMVMLGGGKPYSLVKGVNLLAVELHAAMPWAWELTFDMRFSAIRTVSCV